MQALQFVGDATAQRRKSSSLSASGKWPARSRPDAVQLSGTLLPTRDVTRKWPGPSAICNTTRICESLPVTICVDLSAASACSAEKVFARKVGTVHDSALPRTVVRKNSRLVFREKCSFIILICWPNASHRPRTAKCSICNYLMRIT